MPSAADIKAQIETLPHRYVFWTRKEIRALPEILSEGERILGLTSGMMDGSTWLAVGTDKRIIFVNCGMIMGVRQVQVPLERIQSIENEAMLVFGSIRVWDGATYFTLRMVLKSSIAPFVKAVQEAMSNARRGSVQPAAAAPLDTASQLAKLAELKEKGYLTDEEFLAEKKKLLS